MIVGVVNWTGVSVIVVSVFTTGGLVGRWVTTAMKHLDNRRTEETRAIVLDALTAHMRNEEQIRLDDIKRTKKWRREIKGQIRELREQVIQTRELTTPRAER